MRVGRRISLILASLSFLAIPLPQDGIVLGAGIVGTSGSGIPDGETIQRLGSAARQAVAIAGEVPIDADKRPCEDCDVSDRCH
jgi:hypothetical protein